MSIDWPSVHWGYVALLSAFTFRSAPCERGYIPSPLGWCDLSALLFAVIFVVATYYPHGISLPTLKSSDAPGAPPAPMSTPP